MGFDFGWGNPIGNISEISGTGQLRYREDLRRRNEQRDFDRERMSGDMIAKVEAAKAAGIHPNVVLGGPTASGSPILSQPQGGGISSGSRGSSDADVGRYNAARADLAEIEVEQAQMNLDASQSRLATQPGNRFGGVPVGGGTGAYTTKPAEVTSSALGYPQTSAGHGGPTGTPYYGTNPFTGQPQIGILPSKDISEPMEALGEAWKTVLGFPVAGKYMWDIWMPDEFKVRMFDWFQNMGQSFDQGQYQQWRLDRKWPVSGDSRRRLRLRTGR